MPRVKESSSERVTTVADVGISPIWSIASPTVKIESCSQDETGPLLAVAPIEDMALLQAREDLEDLNSAREALKELKRKGTIPGARIKMQLGLT